MKRIGARFDAVPFGKENTLRTLDEAIGDLESVGDVAIDQDMAEGLLIARDLRGVKRQAEQLSEFDKDDLLLDDFHGLVEEAAGMGFNVGDVQVFTVEEFPEPFREMDWTFFNADKSDTKKYGIPFGIYVKKTAAIPFYTSFLLSHELIHVAIGLRGSDKIARGLEEGLAELLGCICLFSRLRGSSLTANLMIYNRLNYPPNQFWDVYLDNLRQAIVLYQLYGLSGLRTLVEKGRDRIKETEKAILEGRYHGLSLPKGEWDPDVDKLTALVSGFPRNYVVSPLARYVADFISKGTSIQDMLRQNKIDEEQGAEAVHELAKKLFLVVVNEGVIANSDLTTISDPTVLRYLLT